MERESMQDVMPEGARDRAVYDHEIEAPIGRRVADWGGDDLFHQMPRRRFGRATARPRRASGPAEPRSLAARRAAERHGSDEPRGIHDPIAVPLDIRDGRRTVTITGQPRSTVHAAPTDRRRPPRTVEERIGSRPDRVAAWAFGMGLGLILIAVSTADAAPL